MQPKPIATVIDGVPAECRFYPETDTKLIEYRNGDCLVMIGAHDARVRRSLNVRLADEACPVGTFADLWRTYIAACARHGFRPQDRSASEIFFEKTRGYGVLWAKTE